MHEFLCRRNMGRARASKVEEMRSWVGGALIALSLAGISDERLPSGGARVAVFHGPYEGLIQGYLLSSDKAGCLAETRHVPLFVPGSSQARHPSSDDKSEQAGDGFGLHHWSLECFLPD